MPNEIRTHKRLACDTKKSATSRHYHGENYGESRERKKGVPKQDEYARGYRNRVAGRKPVPLTRQSSAPPNAPRSGKGCFPSASSMRLEPRRKHESSKYHTATRERDT
jgi:hypothetical protein